MTLLWRRPLPELHLTYRTLKHAIPPRPIRLEMPGWAGDPEQKRQDGAEPQPWHCVPFVQGNTYGLELIYPHETECVVTHKDGFAHLEWDWTKESGLLGTEFTAFAPGHYGFTTWIEIQSPPGHEVRIEPHPRYFMDRTETVPLALIANVQTQWWPLFLFAVFKVPAPGQKHIFRKGEPYAQLLVVPHRPNYVLEPMNDEQRRKRDALHLSIMLFSQYASRTKWHDKFGYEFDDRYRVLSNAFNQGGYEGVMNALSASADKHGPPLSDDITIEKAMDMALEHHRADRLEDAESIYRRVLMRDPNHADALHLLGLTAHQGGDHKFGAQLIRLAIEINPDATEYYNNLGVCLRALNRNDEAMAVLRTALARQPKSPSVLMNLGEMSAAQGKLDDAAGFWRQVVALLPNEPTFRQRLGAIEAQLGKRS